MVPAFGGIDMGILGVFLIPAFSFLRVLLSTTVGETPSVAVSRIVLPGRRNMIFHILQSRNMIFHILPLAINTPGCWVKTHGF